MRFRADRPPVAETRPPRTARVSTQQAAALIVCVLLAGLWGWWAWQDGAYFGTVFYPGAALLLGLLALLFLGAPFPGKLRGAPLVVACALATLAVWTLASGLWSPTPDSALQDAQQIVAYLAAFGLGLWACLLLGRWMTLSLLPLALGGAVVAVMVIGAVLLGDDPDRFLFGDLTLEFPLGYRNANAAFFLIAFWACIALASDSRLGWWARGAATAAGTLTLGLAVLCQSRGSVPAFAVSLVVFLVVASERRRALLHLAAAAAPLVPALPWLLEVFADGEEVVDALGPLQDAAIAILLAGLAGGLATAALLRFAPPSPAPGRPRKLPRSAAVGLAGLGAAVLVAAAIAVGSGAAVDWLDQASERAGAQPDLSGEGSRFGLNVETERYDVWRVALDELAADPIRGSGAGGFAFAYLAERESIETPQDPHSVEMLMLSELGVPGLVLLIILFGALVVGGLRSRNRGPAAAQLTAGALAAGAYWLAHASLDWFWNYPALTAPTLALLGAAVAPAILSPSRPRRRAARWGLAGACVLLAIALAPPFLSARWTDRAYEQWRVDLEAAYADLGRAQDANPLADEPLLAEGVIAGRSGDEERAVDAFRRARDLEPESWAARYFLGRALIDSDPGAAVAELEIARSLNPSSAGTRRLLDEARRALES